MIDGNKHALLKSGFDGFQQNHLMLKAIDFDNQKLQIITPTNNLPTNDPIKTTFGAS